MQCTSAGERGQFAARGRGSSGPSSAGARSTLDLNLKIVFNIAVRSYWS